MKIFFKNYDIETRAKIQGDPILQELEETSNTLWDFLKTIYYQFLFMGGISILLMPFSPLPQLTIKAMVFFYTLAGFIVVLTYKLGKDCESTITEILEATE